MTASCPAGGEPPAAPPAAACRAAVPCRAPVPAAAGAGVAAAAAAAPPAGVAAAAPAAAAPAAAAGAGVTSRPSCPGLPPSPLPPAAGAAGAAAPGAAAVAPAAEAASGFFLRTTMGRRPATPGESVGKGWGGTAGALGWHECGSKHASLHQPHSIPHAGAQQLCTSYPHLGCPARRSRPPQSGAKQGEQTASQRK